MHFYLLFEAGYQTLDCVDWTEARQVGLNAADERRSNRVDIVWKAGGQTERWSRTAEQWVQLPESYSGLHTYEIAVRYPASTSTRRFMVSAGYEDEAFSHLRVHIGLPPEIRACDCMNVMRWFEGAEAEAIGVPPHQVREV